MPHKLFLPDEIVKALAALLRCEPGRLDTFVAFLDSDRDPESGLSYFAEAAAILGTSHDQAYEEANAVNFVHEQVANSKIGIGDAFSQFLERAVSARLDGANELRLLELESWFSRLMQPRARAKLAAKRRRLAHGLGWSAVSFRAYCDARPVFDLEHKRILEMLPIATMRVRVSNDRGGSKDYVFQMGSEAINDLKKQIETLESKIERLRQEIPNVSPRDPKA